MAHPTHSFVVIRHLAAAVLACAVAFPAGALATDRVEQLPEEIRSVAERFNLPADSLGILVRAPGEAEPRLAFNAEHVFNPASVMKLFTTFAVLDGLGPSHVWETKVYADGPIRDGVLEGNLWIQGSGDPYLIAQEFWQLTGSIHRRGIETIAGDLILDTSLFAPSHRHPGDFDDEPYRAYNQLAHPLLVNFNVVAFDIEPVSESAEVRVVSYPPMANMPLDNRLEFTEVGCPMRTLQYDVRHAADGPEVVLAGRFGQSCGRGHLVRRAMPVERYVHGLFDALWTQWGGQFGGTLRIDTLPADAGEPVVVHRSRNLTEAVRLVNKYSNNVMTNQLALTLAAEQGHIPASEQDAIAAVRERLEIHGLDLEHFVLEEVAGLSRDNRVSPKLVVELLDVAARSHLMPEFLSSLPIAGVDGTMRRRFRNEPEAGQMRLKTGRIDDVSAVAGYVTTRDGEPLQVAILVNAPHAQRYGGIPLQDAVLRWAWSSAGPATP